MPPQTGQSLANWLMFLPLLIVPAIAIFGVPQLTPLSVGTVPPSEPDLELSLGGEAPLAEQVPPFPSGSIEQGRATNAPANNPPASWNDPFANPQTIDKQSHGSPEPRTASLDANDPFAAPQANGNSAQSPNRQPSNSNDVLGAGYSRATSSERISSPNPTQPQNADALTWQSAVKRLNQLGVRQIQLSQTEEPFVFRFACDFTPEANPRITHRFESEANEPLRAVEKVIEQVENWLAQQRPQ